MSASRNRKRDGVEDNNGLPENELKGNKESLSGNLWRCSPCFDRQENLVFCGCSSVIKAMSIETGEQVFRLIGHLSLVSSLALHPQDDDGLLSASHDGTIRHWDTKYNKIDPSKEAFRCIHVYNIGYRIMSLLSCPKIESLEGEKQALSIYALTGEVIHPRGSTSLSSRKRKLNTNSNSNHSVSRGYKTDKENISYGEDSCTQIFNVQLGHQSEDSLTPVFNQILSATGIHATIIVDRERYWIVQADKYFINVIDPVTQESWFTRCSDERGIITSITSNGSTIATGHYSGQIILWYSLGEEAEKGIARIGKNTKIKPFIKTKHLHWHSHSISCLNFSSDGNYLYSGGEEGVLVQWTLTKTSKSFLPRLGAPLSKISLAQSGAYCALSTEDNSFMVVNVANWHLDWKLRGLTLSPTHELIDYSDKIRLTVEPKNKSIVVNGQPGFLQYFDLHRDLLSAELEVVPFNRVSRVESELMAPPIVEYFAFSPDGERIVTVDARYIEADGRQNLMKPRLSLKFWILDKSSNIFMVDATFDSPHRGAVTSLEYHPISDIVVTTSFDCSFKIWSMCANKARIESAKETAKHWSCLRTTTYKTGLKAESSCFSTDGSVLCVSFGGIITVWADHGSKLLRTMLPVVGKPGFEGCLRSISCIPDSTVLLAENSSIVVSWNVVNCMPIWQYFGDISCVTSTKNRGISINGIFGSIALCIRRVDKHENCAHRCTVLLMNEHDAIPIYAWHLNDDYLLKMVFSDSSNSEKVGIVGLTSRSELILLSIGGDKGTREGGTGLVRLSNTVNFPALIGVAIDASGSANGGNMPHHDLAAPRKRRDTGLMLQGTSTVNLPHTTVLLDRYMESQLQPARKALKEDDEKSSGKKEVNQSKQSDSDIIMEEAEMPIYPPTPDIDMDLLELFEEYACSNIK